MAHLFLSWCVVLWAHSRIPSHTFTGYKLYRFYNPSSEEEYVTTRATLTLFSEFFFLFFVNMLT